MVGERFALPREPRGLPYNKMDEKNKLYFGDNLKILRKHQKDASVDLIYLDPPRTIWYGARRLIPATLTTCSSRKRAATTP